MVALRYFLVLAVVLVSTCPLAFASDPKPLQDFCVADPNAPVLVNGVVCKDPKLVQADDFFFKGLNIPANTSNPGGFGFTVAQIPGLNTLGISMGRGDYAPGGINPPHLHPPATEVLTVTKGKLLVGFVTSNNENRLISKVLLEGDVFVFPQGLVHFQQNVGDGNAVSITALSSQNPGIVTIANAVFGSNPDIPTDLLAKAFHVDAQTIALCQSKF